VKVALLVPGGVDRSGTHRVVPCLLSLIERLVERGDEVHVFALQHDPVPGRWSLLGATVRNAGKRPRSLRTLWSMFAEHWRAPFDVIHAVCYWNRTAAVGAVASWLIGVPLVLTLVDGEVVSQPAIAFGGQRTWRSRLALRMAAKRARVVTAQSDFMRDLAVRLGISARTVILGVDLRRWPLLPARPRVADARLRLLHVGRLTPVKDHITLLEAMAILRQEGQWFELEAIGEGALSATVAQAARRFAVADVVHFRPIMAQSELRPWFERADLLVVSSIHESGPLVALEAAVAGIPTVGTAVGYVSDWAPTAALAVPVRDPAALAAAIRELADDEARRLALAANAQRIAVRSDASETARLMREIYREAASASIARAPSAS
jgi:glycosyltransferase involved in cell wall biosynthesis